MKILVMCGAGASSTFVAQRIRRAAARAGRSLELRACGESELDRQWDWPDLLLVGPHLKAFAERAQNDARFTAVLVRLLPPDIFSDMTGERALQIVDRAAAGTDN